MSGQTISSSYITSRYQEMSNDFLEFNENNPEIWDLFVKFTRQAINSGLKRYSAKAIFERIRWEAEVNSSAYPREFKVNNNYHAFYARWFMERYPEYDGFFVKREQKSKSDKPSFLPNLTPEDLKGL